MLRCCDAVAEILNRAGAQRQGGGIGDQAMAACDEFRPDVLLCDIAMPGEDGYSFFGVCGRSVPREGGTPRWLSLRWPETAIAAGLCRWISGAPGQAGGHRSFDAGRGGAREGWLTLPIGSTRASTDVACMTEKARRNDDNRARRSSSISCRSTWSASLVRAEPLPDA